MAVKKKCISSASLSIDSKPFLASRSSKTAGKVFLHRMRNNCHSLNPRIQLSMKKSHPAKCSFVKN